MPIWSSHCFRFRRADGLGDKRADEAMPPPPQNFWARTAPANALPIASQQLREYKGHTF